MQTASLGSKITKLSGRFFSRRSLIVFHDIFVITAAYPVAIILRDWPNLREGAMEAMWSGTIVLLLLTTIVYSCLAVHRGMWRYATLGDLFAAAKLATLITIIFVPVMFLIDRFENVPRLSLIIMWLLAVVGICGSRAIYSRMMRPRSSANVMHEIDHSVVPILLVGGGDTAELVIHLCERNRGRPMAPKVVGILDDSAAVGRTLGGVQVMGGLKAFRSSLTRLRVMGIEPKRLIVTKPPGEFHPQDFRSMMTTASMVGLAVDQLADLLRFRGEVPETRPTAKVRMELEPQVDAYHRLKRIVDMVGSAAALLALSPLFLLIAFCVRLSQRESVLFEQVRIGRNGHEFTLYKFRTMSDPAAPDGGLLPDSERGLRLGAFLRRSRLDELPQLFNVLLGEMSLIGPRPLLLSEQPKVGDTILTGRLSVRPGLSGWAQVNGGQMLTSKQKNALDLFYIHNASPLMDTRIAILTLQMLLLGEKVNHKEIHRAETVFATG